VVRSLIDSGLVYHDGTGWRAREAISTLAVPESVQSVILSRVDRLDQEVRHVLQSAAVIGRLFRQRLLGQVVEKEVALERALSVLEDRQLIYEERAIPEEEYSFQHVLTQETVYQNILRRRRAVFHGHVAEAMEQLYAANLEEYCEQLAHHYEQAGMAEKAVEYLLRAGEKARRAFLNEDAVQAYQRALTHLEETTLGRRHWQWQLEALAGLGRAYYYGLGRIAEAIACFRRAIALGRGCGLSPVALARFYHWLFHASGYDGSMDETAAEVRRAGEEWLAASADVGESVEAAIMYALLIGAYHHQLNLPAVRAFTERLAQVLVRVPYFPELRDVHAVLMLSLSWDKRIEEAHFWAARLERLAQEHEDPAGVAAGVFQGVFSLWSTGHLAEAAEGCRRSAPLFERRDVTDSAHVYWCLALLCVERGELEEARQSLARAETLLGGTKSLATEGDVAWLRAVVALCAGDVEGARDYLRHALACPSHREAGAWVWLTAGHVAMAAGEPVKALGHFEQCLRQSRRSSEDSIIMQSATVPAALSGMEAAGAGRAHLTAQVERLRPLGPQVWMLPRVPCLQPATVAQHAWLTAPGLADEGGTVWQWHDPLGGCAHAWEEDGLLLSAANGCDLWYANLSAPCLLQTLPGSDFALETRCGPVARDRPAIGGLLLWHDRNNYLVLEHGRWGAADIAFRGCLDGEDCLIGRGWLPGEQMSLRLERRGSTVRALCSADGTAWFTAGDVAFPAREGGQVGVYAIGMIDRAIYHGAYPDGTAIRFESFELWTDGRDDLLAESS
jgi:tetratricopeptide (TPR) repeat protein